MRIHARTYWIRALCSLAVCLLAIVSMASAQIVLDNTSQGTVTTTTPLSFSHTIGAGSNRLLVVSVSVEDTVGFDVTDVSYDGVSLTQAIEHNVGSATFINTEIWYLLEAQLPAPGTYTVQVTTAGGSPADINAGAISVTGAAQQAPEATAFADDGEAGAAIIQQTITTLTDGAWIFDAVGSGNAVTFTPDPGQTQFFDFEAPPVPTTSGGAGSYELKAAAGAETQGWTADAGSNRASYVLAAFAPFPFTKTVYYSVGTSVADFKNGSPTVTISGGVATLTTAQPDNVGVGDEITYDGGTRAYISGRTSSTVYSVTTATGTLPSGIGGATVDSIRRAFNSLDQATSASADINHLNTSDLVAADIQLNWAAYNDGPDTVSAAIEEPWVTGPGNYIRLFTPVGPNEVGISQRHSGVAGTGYRLAPVESPGVGTYRILQVSTDFGHVRVEGIEIDGSNVTNAEWIQGINLSDSSGSFQDVRISHNIIHDITNSTVDDSTQSDAWGLHFGDADDCKVWNNIIYNITNVSTHASSDAKGIEGDIGSITNYVYNNTVYNILNTGSAGEAVGIEDDAGNSLHAKNNFVGLVDSASGFEACFNQTFASESNNVSSDGTAVGATGQASYASYFVSVTPGSENLHLLGDSTALWTISGADLDSDANLPVTDDMDAEARDATTPDVGADEFDASAGARTVYYSVGTSVADLKNGSPTITIASGVATLSTAQPDNVGVGDEITYNGSTRAYISGRTSSTTYRVTTANGGVPADVVGASVTTITRAFNTVSAASSGSADVNHLNTTDLVAGNIQLNWAGYDDGPMSDVTSGWVGADISGWTTGVVNFIRLFAPATTTEVGISQRHTGVAGTGFRLVPIQPAPNSFFPILNVTIGHLRLEGIEIDGSSVSNGEEVNGIVILGPATSGSDLRFDKLLIHDITNTTIDDTDASFTKGIAMQDGNLRLSNSIIYDITNVSTNANSYAMGVELNEPTATHYLFNNTFYSILQNAGAGGAEADGIVEWSGNATVRNTFIGDVVSLSGAENCLRSVTAQSNNVSSDGTAIGATGQNLYATYFKSVVPGSEDLHLLGDSLSLWTIAGMDLDADPNLPVVDDIDGQLRDPSAPDIGADELDIDTVYYSVGVSGADFKNGSPTVTITNGVATFTTAQPDNVGLGDEVTHSGGTRVYISERLSSTVYRVTTALGTVPTPDVAGATVNSITRAFNSLNQAATDSDDVNHLSTADLVAAGIQLNWVAYNDGPDPTNATIQEPWITGPNHYIRVFTPVGPTEVGVSQRHNGTAGTGYRIAPSTAAPGAFYSVVHVSNDTGYVRIEGIEIDGTNVTNGETIRGIQVDDGAANQDVRISHNLIHDITATTIDDSDLSESFGIVLNDTDNSKVSNNIIYNVTTESTNAASGAHGIEGRVSGRTYYVYNNTVYNILNTGNVFEARGIFDAGGGTLVARNNYVGLVDSTAGAENDYLGAFAAASNNVSSDGTATGAGSQTGQSTYASYFASVTPGSEDLHLLADSSALWGAVGADLDGDLAIPIIDDIDGDARDALTPDVGADESVGTASLTLADHDAGQVPDAFSVSSPVTDVLLRFKLTASGVVTIDTVRVNFTVASGVVNGDVSAGELWEDTNGNGVIDGGDVQIEGGVAPSGGVLTFTTNFAPSTTGTNYLVRATVANLFSGDTTTFSLAAADIDEIQGGVVESGSVTGPVHAMDVIIRDVYYSVGTAPGDLKTGAPTIAITAGTATLSVAQTGNIGVGDAIDYGAGLPVFIHAVTSQTVFEVRTETGLVPGDTGAVSVTSITRAFASITAAEGGTAALIGTTNLATAGVRVTWVVYNDAPLVEAAQIDGYITDATHYITLTAAGSSQIASGVSQRHLGVAGTGAVVRPPAGAAYAIYVGDVSTTVEWLDLDGTNVTATGSDGVEVGVGGNDSTLQNLLIHHWDEASDDGIWVGEPGVTIRNSIVYNNNGSIHLQTDDATVRNVSIFGGAYGLLVNGGSGHVIENVIVVSSAPDFSGPGTVSASNNMSSDGTATTFGGGGHITGVAAAEQFISVAPGVEDLHLRPGADAIDTGVDRSGFFTGDIDTQTRALGAAWDMGADETQFSASNAVYYSVGIDGTNLMAGSPNVDVTSGTAIFSTAQPDNVGAGDVITYGGNSAYIWRRVSSTVYNVLNETGSVPTDAVAAPVTSITRAFTSLTLAQAGSSDVSHLNGSDLVAGDFQLNWVCYDDGPMNDRLDLAGWTTGADNYIRIYTPVNPSEVGVSQRHNGVSGTGFHLAPVDATVAAYYIIFLRTEFVRIEGLEIDGTGLTAARSARGIGVLKNMANVGDIRLSSNIIHDLHTTQPGNDFDGSFGIYAFEDVDTMGPPLLVTNNFIYDVTASIPEDNHHIGGIHISTRTTSLVENNTIFHIHNTGAPPGGATWGIEVSAWPAGSATVIAKNNFVGDLLSANDVERAFESNNGGMFTQNNNVSSDATASGAGSQTGQTSYATYFTSIADGSENLHITADSLTLWGTTGEDLSSAFTVDIDGGTRQTPWDIGADDVLATTAVELIGFEAMPLDSAVELAWETGSELNNLGFHVYRGSSASGPFERITSSVIPGLGNSPVGARYRYRDEGLENGTTYYYELEDIETTGVTKRHGPLPATPLAGATLPGDDGPGVSSRITYGDPSANGLRVLKQGAHSLALELITEGFYAVPQEDGTVAIEIPGFDALGEASTPTMPVKHHWVEAIAGRKVELGSVHGRLESVASGWTVSSATEELAARSSGTVRVRRRRQRMNARAEGMFPAEAARIVTVGFQGESKKALVEMAPLRWIGETGELYLARRLVIRVSFRGIEPSERGSGGRRGRRRRRPRVTGQGVLARLTTTTRGLYGVRYEALFGTRGRIGVDELRLSRQGNDVAFHVEPANGRFSRGSTLYFVGEGADANRYGNEAVYELQLATSEQPGTRMAVSDANPWGVETTWYRKRDQQEVNQYYQAALVDAPDLWLWDLLLAPVTKSYPFEVSALASTVEPGRVEVWLQGTSDTPAYPDHHVRLYVNGAFLTETSWNGKAPQRLDAELAPGVLVEGTNALELENVGDTEATYSTVMLDRFAVTYPRRLVLEEGVLEGTFGESGMANVQGIVIETSDTPAWRGDVSSFPVEAGQSFLVVQQSAVLTPEVKRPTATTLTSSENQADYIVIGPRAFVEAAAPLLSHRAEQGLVSRGVPIEDVFAEFGHGESTPEALHAFLAYAYHEWRAPTLRYVVLLGDGSYDYKDYAQLGGANPVPPLMVRTSYLWTASDPTLAAVNGDDLLPDVAIGRLPAASVEEVSVIVSKIIAWEMTEYGVDGPAVLVADNPDVAGDFVADAEAAANRLPAGTEVTRIYLNELGASQTTASIVSAFDGGASLMSYIGHGGIHLWADENVFNTKKLATLSQQSRQPLLLTMNCLNGYFHFPYFGSLAEELLKAENKGVIAAFSPSGLSLNTPAQLYHRAMLDELFSGQHSRLGDAVLGAQEAYVESGAFPELLTIYHLFGDPALKLR